MILALLVTTLISFITTSSGPYYQRGSVTVPEGINIAGPYPPVATATTPNSYSPHFNEPPISPPNPSPLTLTISRHKSPVSAPQISPIEDQRCNEFWSSVYTLVEEILEEQPESIYAKLIESFRILLEDVTAPVLIDAANTALGTKGQRQIGKEVDKLRKKLTNLTHRRNVLDKHPEYSVILNHFNQQMTDLDTFSMQNPDKKSLVNSCYLPAYLAHFLLNAMKIEEETEYQIINFKDNLQEIVITVVKAIKQKTNRRGKTEVRGTVLEKRELKDLEKFQSALKAKIKRSTGGSGGGFDFDVSVLTVGILVFVIVLFVGASVIFLIMRQRGHDND